MEIMAILYLVMAISEEGLPPLWLWIVMGVLFVFSMILLASSMTSEKVPKSKLN